MNLDPDPRYEPEPELDETPRTTVYLVDVLIVAGLAAIIGCALVALALARP